jgi:hypothetical protein
MSIKAPYRHAPARAGARTVDPRDRDVLHRAMDVLAGWPAQRDAGEQSRKTAQQRARLLAATIRSSGKPVGLLARACALLEAFPDEPGDDRLRARVDSLFTAWIDHRRALLGIPRGDP